MKQKDISTLIRDAGFRVTKQRVAVLNFLRKLRYPVGVQEVVAGVKGSDQVTAYRILQAFAHTGLVREVDLRQGRALYEYADAADEHHHAVCTQCDRVEDFNEPAHKSFVRAAAKKVRGFATITHHSFELFGVCNACAKNNL